jgi:hypothetical protein
MRRLKDKACDLIAAFRRQLVPVGKNRTEAAIVGSIKALTACPEARQLLKSAFEHSGLPSSHDAIVNEGHATLDDSLYQLHRWHFMPVAIEAFWEGDTTGWFVVLAAISQSDSLPRPTYQQHDLLAISFGGDMRIFNNTVPPWPEAAFASALGSLLAKHYQVPFYFPAPDWPDDETPHWGQEPITHCESCGKPQMHVGQDNLCHPCWIKKRAGK